MKNSILIITISFLFAACGNRKAELDANKEMLLRDSLALIKSNILTDRAHDSIVKDNAIKAERAQQRNTPENRGRSNGNTNSGSVKNNDGGSSSTETQGTTVSNQDKGWSNAAKGTAIGAAGGAVLGAVVSKNKAAGAVIGGVVGGAGGYAIGRAKDRKSGRVARKKAARTNN